MKNPLTASERRGVIAIAALALLITAGGFLFSISGSSDAQELPEPTVETIVDGDTVKPEKPGRKKKEKKARKYKKASKKKQKKNYGRRNPLDEPV